jgi:hypothetical protein
VALQNPSNLYSGGQGILRDDVVGFIANQEAKKRAKEDALNQYFTKLPEKLNMAGVRLQDLEDPNGNGGIYKDIEDWKSGWRPGMTPQEQQEHLMKYQKIKFKTEQSKARGRKMLRIRQMQLEGKFYPRDTDIKILDQMDKSIYDPESYKDDGVSEFDERDLSSAVGAYTPQDQLTFERAAIGQAKPEYDPKSKGVRMDASGKILLKKKYKPENIYAAGEQAANLLTRNKKAQYYYEDLLDNPDAVKTASDMLSKVAGVNVLAETPQQMAAGLMMAKLSGVEIEDEEKDVDAANRFKKQLQDERIEAQLKRTREIEAGKNKRTKMLLDGVEIRDVLGIASKYKFKYKIPTWQQGKAFPFGVEETDLIPLENVDAVEKDDILGKADNYGRRPVSPIEIEGKEYLRVTPDGRYFGDNNQEIAPERVINATFNRTKGEVKARYKKEIKVYNPKTGKFE